MNEFSAEVVQYPIICMTEKCLFLFSFTKIPKIHKQNCNVKYRIEKCPKLSEGRECLHM